MSIAPALTAPLSRRGLLTASAATGIGLARPAWAATPRFALADSARLSAMMAPSLAALGPLARVERLGTSEQGRPIDLISIGSGARSALIVGAPHPNEPVGCLTIVAMIRRLAEDRSFRERSGYRWHFIPAIDVDGLALNAGWLDGPATSDAMMRGFFRPAFVRQPEYGFPIAVPGYRFDAVPPETRCWQRALEIARPTFQSSLHGNDSSGAFYMLSRDRPTLAQRLSRQPRELGIALATLGEPGATNRSFAPGVLSFFEIAPLIEAALRAGEPVDRVWSAGRSSAEHAAATYGSFSMTCEVPLWEDRRQFSTRPSRYSHGDVLRLQLAEAHDNARLFDLGRSLSMRDFEDADSRALALAVREAAAMSVGQRQSIEAQMVSSDAARRVSLAELVQLEPGTTMMRAPAMLARLAERAGEPGIAAQVRAALARRLARYRAEAPLIPIPVARTIALQMRSILTAAADLRTG
jgi:hypothetical protein